ncbi:MAG: hypothetical protein F6K30_09935 [Cyanothece sp. SIO2G6]|nr:hypothetical protein [Cyanothece sp. SIO2G6]
MHLPFLSTQQDEPTRKNLKTFGDVVATAPTANVWPRAIAPLNFTRIPPCLDAKFKLWRSP